MSYPAYKAAIRARNVGQIMTGSHGWDDSPHLGGDSINYSSVMINGVLRANSGDSKGLCVVTAALLGETSQNLLAAKYLTK